MRLSGSNLLDLYYARVFDASIDIEDADLEEQWLKSHGWTLEEFELLIAQDSFGDLID